MQKLREILERYGLGIAWKRLEQTYLNPFRGPPMQRILKRKIGTESFGFDVLSKI